MKPPRSPRAGTGGKAAKPPPPIPELVKQTPNDDHRALYDFDSPSLEAAFVDAIKSAQTWVQTDHNYNLHEADYCTKIAEFILELIPPDEIVLLRRKINSDGFKDTITSGADLLPHSVVDWMDRQKPPIPMPHFGAANPFHSIVTYFHANAMAQRRYIHAGEAADLMEEAEAEVETGKQPAKPDSERSKNKRLAKWVLMAVDQGNAEIIEPRGYKKAETAWNTWCKTHASLWLQPAAKVDAASEDAKRKLAALDAEGTPAPAPPAAVVSHPTVIKPPIGGDIEPPVGAPAVDPVDPVDPFKFEGGQPSNEPIEQPKPVQGQDDWWFAFDQSFEQPKARRPVTIKTKSVAADLGIEADGEGFLRFKMVDGELMIIGIRHSIVH